LWAADHSEFHSLVCAVTDDLVGVVNFNIIFSNILVEPVGAPPACVPGSNSINFHFTPYFSSYSSFELEGDAGGVDKDDTCWNISSIRRSNCSRFLGSDEFIEFYDAVTA